MDRAGYKAYLQALGNQQHYIGRIQMLLDLERELNIDLDDYIPYDQDYSKSAALDAIMPQEKRYDEKLWFSINSYMLYRLSGFDDCGELNNGKNLEPSCSEYFTFDGAESDLRTELSKFMSESDSRVFVSGLKDYRPFLDTDEYFIETPSFAATDSHSSPKKLQLLIESSNININIKATTIMALALLLDIKLTLGIASVALTVVGFNGQAIGRDDLEYWN